MSIAAGNGAPYEIAAEGALRLALHRLGDAQLALAIANAENAHHALDDLSPPHSKAELRRLFLMVRTSIIDLQQAQADVEHDGRHDR